MSETINDDDRRTILRAISEINSEIRDEKDFREFGATTDLDYQMSDARLAGLRAEKSELKKLLPARDR